MNFCLSAFAIFVLAHMPLQSFSKADSFCIYFRSGVSSLDDAQTRHLDSLLYAGIIHPGTTINIVGYADEPGTNALNRSIATNRAASVKAYLLSSGIEQTQIGESRGLGNKVRSGDDMHQRRVDILLGRPLTKNTPTVAKTDTVPQTRRRSLQDIKTMKPGELMVIENLQFKVSTDTFEPESLPILKELAEVLLDLPEVKIKLEGHICCGGKTDSSKQLSLGYELSLSRSRAVLRYLIRHGVSATRLSCVGFGFSRPKVFPERNPADSYINRRVEIRIVSNK